MHTGQHIRTDSGSSWFFDAGRIALDFAHTGGFADDPDARRPRARLGELLVTPADLDEWLGDHTEPIDLGATARELQDARALRAAIGRLAVARRRHPRPRRTRPRAPRSPPDSAPAPVGPVRHRTTSTP